VIFQRILYGPTSTCQVSSVFALARKRTFAFPQAVVEEPCSPPPILEETELAFGLELPPPSMRSSSSSSSGSYDLKDAMADPSNDLEQIVSATVGHISEIELDRDVSVHYGGLAFYREIPLLNGSVIRRKK